MRVKYLFSQLHLRMHLALLLSGVTILLTVVLVLAIGFLAGREMKAFAGNRLAKLAFDTADKLDRGMFERYREVQLMAQREELTNPQVPITRKRKILRSLQDAYPYYAWIGVADMQGKVTAEANALLEEKNVAARPWFQRALAGNFLGDVHDAELLSKLIPNPGGEPLRLVDIAFPLTDQAGAKAGVLGVHLSWQWAHEIERSLMVPIARDLQADAMIIDSNGAVLLGPQGMLGTKIDLSGYRLQSNPGYVRELHPDERDYLVGASRSRGYATYPGMGWTILVRQPVDVAFAPVRALQKQILLAGLILAFAFSLLGVALARQISRPLQALSHAASGLGEDADKIVLANDGCMEVSLLKDALNQLIGKLHGGRQELRDLAVMSERSREEERVRLATRIHDDIGTALTALHAYLGYSKERHQRNALPPDPHLASAAAVLDQAVLAVRSLISELRPSVLDHLGLWPAVEWYLEQLERQTGVFCEICTSPLAEETLMTRERMVNLFRLLQEAIAFATRDPHAISLQVNADVVGDTLCLALHANHSQGRGLPDVEAELRLAGLRERARQVGGTMTCDHPADTAMLIVFHVPMEIPANQNAARLTASLADHG